MSYLNTSCVNNQYVLVKLTNIDNAFSVSEESNNITNEIIENNNSYVESKNNTRTKKLDDIDGLSVVNDIINIIGKEYLGEKIKLRIKYLVDIHDNDISINSLKSLLRFLLIIPQLYEKPTITINENNIFQASWKKDAFKLITVRFNSKNSMDLCGFKEE